MIREADVLKVTSDLFLSLKMCQICGYYWCIIDKYRINWYWLTGINLQKWIKCGHLLELLSGFVPDKRGVETEPSSPDLVLTPGRGAELF